MASPGDNFEDDNDAHKLSTEVMEKAKNFKAAIDALLLRSSSSSSGSRRELVTKEEFLNLLNNGTEEELKDTEGLGTRVEVILEHRQQSPFKNLSDVAAVLNLSSNQLDGILAKFAGAPFSKKKEQS